MTKVDSPITILVNSYSLKMACNTLREAILRLPRGVVRERLFVSVLKAIGHLHKGRLVLMQRVFASMRILAKDPAVTEEVRVSLMEVSNQLDALLHASMCAL